VSQETIQWADGFLLVYSITDRQSFNYVKRVKQQLLSNTSSSGESSKNGGGGSNTLSVHSFSSGGSGGGSGNNGLTTSSTTTSFSFRDEKGGGQGGQATILPVVLVANKADLIHLRQISTEEGKKCVCARGKVGLFAWLSRFWSESVCV